MNVLFWRVDVRCLRSRKRGRDSDVRPNGGSELPHQAGCAGWWRDSSARLFCQCGGALERLAGPCEAGVRTGGRQEQGTGRETAVQSRQLGGVA